MTDAAVDSQSAVQWVHQGKVVLSLAHKNIILSGDELSDLHINFAQLILKKQWGLENGFYSHY